jgi:hypothetical protein
MILYVRRRETDRATEEKPYLRVLGQNNQCIGGILQHLDKKKWDHPSRY